MSSPERLKLTPRASPQPKNLKIITMKGRTTDSVSTLILHLDPRSHKHMFLEVEMGDKCVYYESHKKEAKDFRRTASPNYENNRYESKKTIVLRVKGAGLNLIIVNTHYATMNIQGAYKLSTQNFVEPFVHKKFWVDGRVYSCSWGRPDKEMLNFLAFAK